MFRFLISTLIWAGLCVGHPGNRSSHAEMYCSPANRIQAYPRTTRPARRTVKTFPWEPSPICKPSAYLQKWPITDHPMENESQVQAAGQQPQHIQGV